MSILLITHYLEWADPPGPLDATTPWPLIDVVAVMAVPTVACRADLVFRVLASAIVFWESAQVGDSPAYLRLPSR
ncbi:hypothetical protein [Microlunatus sp. Gsoil 973]|uniref:hypothetical protein n=1 Tax=Microlunatus sp. Gsoil 973 TaxID=2672569 RepID=UPI0012B49D99|nr:hypothetical protein [Microlunatus sp. Gsoil 973]QGN32579.1 hypothetical protein GJV80_06925 [Microlunatus sp. Gsoil 973]